MGGWRGARAGGAAGREEGGGAAGPRENCVAWGVCFRGADLSVREDRGVIALEAPLHQGSTCLLEDLLLRALLAEDVVEGEGAVLADDYLPLLA